MALNVERLLKKKGWTGEELGILEVTNVIHCFVQALQGTENPKPLVSNAEFSKMLATIDDPTQGRIYNGYLKIHEWLSRVFNIATSQEQQAQLRYNEFIHYISNAKTAETLYQYIEELPVIMTEKQYKSFVDKRKEEILHPDGKEIGFNVFNLLQEALYYYVGQLQKNPRKKNPLKPLKKKLEAELVKDPRILSRYNEVMGNGYYSLPDGTRSDKVTREEWEKALAPEVKDALEDEDSSRRYSMSWERQLQLAHNLYNGMSWEEANKSIENKDIEAGLFQKAEWHFYEDPPEDLTKWEILETGDLFEYYPSLEGKPPEGKSYEEAIAEDAAAFKKEFPTVVKALLQDMEQYIKGVSSIPVKKWADTSLTWDELDKLNIYGFRELYTDHSAIFDETQRAIAHGVAVLQPESLKHCRNVDSEGNYQPPAIREVIEDFSLEGFFTDREGYSQRADKIEADRQVLLESLYFLNGYNNALDIIADYYKIEAVKSMKIEVASFENQIEAFNDFVAMLYKQIATTNYEDKGLQEKKLGVLKDIFYPLDIKETRTPEEKLKTAREWLKGFQAFKDSKYELTTLLCFKQRGGVGYGRR